MNNLGCSGTEYRLKDCSYSEGSDRHSEDWSITCNNGIHNDNASLLQCSTVYIY